MKKNNWISVTERLPEEGKLVFILAGKHIGDVYVARLRQGISKDERYYKAVLTNLMVIKE